MAGIDKTYTVSYKDYKEFKDWADTQIVTFFNGHKECVGDYVWTLEEADFTEERSIMNTPIWMDAYLIQNCRSGFVLDRMKEVHGNCYEELASVNLTSKPEGFEQNRKILIRRNSRTRFPLHNKPYSGGKWWLQCRGDLSYDMESKTWGNKYYPHNTNTSSVGSVKAVVRQLRKQYLPKGIEFNISGRGIGEAYKILIK